MSETKQANSKLYTKDDMASLLSVTTKTITRWIQEGRIPDPDLRISNQWRWKQATVDRLTSGEFNN